MKKINLYSVEIIKDPRWGNKFVKQEYEVGLENEKYVVIKDLHFTILDKKGDRSSSHHIIGNPSVSEWKTGLDSLDGIHYTLWTYKTKRPETIKREIQAFVEERFGYISNINLDFIK